MARLMLVTVPMNENKIKHLEFIQAIITRMNSNSFQIKNWAITIIAAFLALYASGSNPEYILAAIVPTLVFWLLDAYYLQQERMFRALYNDVATERRAADFRMPINEYGQSFWSTFFSRTIWVLYSVGILFLILLYCCKRSTCCCCDSF